MYNSSYNVYSHVPTNFNNRLEQLKLRLKKNIEAELFIDQLDIECSCCYSFRPIDDFVRCEKNHLICTECVKSHSKNMIYTNGNFNIGCINTLEPCECVYSDEILEKILEKKVYHEYVKIKIRAETKYIFSMEGINLIKCQFCETCWDIDPTEKILYCMQCSKKTCLECNQQEHKGRPCDKIRIKIEEALTKENFLICSNCSRCIFKEAGCNAVRCPCGNNMCWGCKKNVDSRFNGCDCSTQTRLNGLNEFTGNILAQEYINKLR